MNPEDLARYDARVVQELKIAKGGLERIHKRLEGSEGGGRLTGVWRRLLTGGKKG